MHILRTVVLTALIAVVFTPAVTKAGSVAAAKSRVTMAKEYQAADRTEDAEKSLQSAEKFLDGLSDEEKAPIVAEIKAVREKLAAAIKPEDARKISAAKGKLRQARRQIEAKESGIEDTLKAAENYLEGVPDAQKAAVLEEIEAVRKEVGGGEKEPAKPAGVKPATPAKADGSKPAADAKPDAAKPAADAKPDTAKPAPDAKPAAELSEEDAATLSKVKGNVRRTKTLLETGRTENIEAILEETEDLLKSLPEAYKAPILAEIKDIRANTSGAVAGEDVRRVEEELNRHIYSAEADIEAHPQDSAEVLKRVTGRLADDDVTKALAPEAIAAFKARIVDVRSKLDSSNKTDALGRAMPLLEELEQRLATDPFKGLDQREAYVATSDLQTLKNRVLGAVYRLPEDDADVKKINARLLVTDQKIDKASAAWGKAVLDAEVGGSWELIKKDVAGWEQEGPDPKAQPLEAPDMRNCRVAVSCIHYWLNSDETKKTRAENKGDPTLEATYAEAEKVFDAAAEKLNVAFNKVLEEAEKMPAPLRRLELDGPGMLAFRAEYALANTKFQEPVTARARKLDEKWKAEVAAIMKARQALYDKLSGEAAIKWPGIVAALGAKEGFDPADTSAVGKTVVLTGVYNRAAWDFSGRDYDFSMRLNGIPIAGNYEPYIMKALEHAWYELKLDVNDRIRWDVVAVVEGPGKIGERTILTLKDKDTNLEIGKIEEYRPIDCVRLKIIALHAGPVASGPGN